MGGPVFALTSPPTDLYPAVWLGLALLAASISDAPSGWRAFGRGAAWGTSAGIVGLRFVPTVIQRFTPLGSAASYLALVLLAAAQSLIWAIGSAAAHQLRRRARVPFEIAFAGGVYVAVLLPTVFLWTPAGLVSRWSSLVQLADFIGERGVTAIFAVAAALTARTGLGLAGLEPGDSLAGLRPAAPAVRWARRTWLPVALALALFGFLAAYGKLRIAAIERATEGLPRARIGLIDQSVGPHERWEQKNVPSILRKLKDLTVDAERRGAELVVWPEAAYPYALEHGATKAPKGERSPLGHGVHGPLLVGLITREQPVTVDGHTETNSKNSATIVARDGALQPTYDKMQLLWFGEMVPGGAYLPWLRRMFQRSGGLIPGAEPVALTLERTDGPALRMAVLNCYEDTLPGVGRQHARALSPNLLVNVTNDAWFFGTAEPELHARLATMRAVELRRDLVRAVNMGVTSWVDAAGVVRARDDTDGPGVVLVEPTLRDDAPTLYTRFGEWPVALLFVALAAAHAWRARRQPIPSSGRA